MKKLLTFIFVLAMAQYSFAQDMSGTAHDFTGATWNATAGEMCNVCHTPHNSNGAAGAPLWNHTSTTATYTLYTSNSLDAATGQPAGTSKLCLSCHDGTIGLDEFGGATPASPVLMTGNALFGTDLSNDHPISFTYNTALATADGELVDPVLASSSGLGTTIEADMLFGTAGAKTMECASCHDVHNAIDTAPGQGLLLKSNAASALCLTCHAK